MKTVGMTEFTSDCAQLLESVQQTGESLVVTRRQRPLVTVSPCQRPSTARRLGALRGRMTILGDIVRGDFGDDWEMEQ